MSCLYPYKTIGILTNQPYLYLRRGQRPAMITITNKSIKLWSIPDLKILMIGPRFNQNVQLATSLNQQLFLVIAGELLCLKYHHLVYKQALPILKDGQVLTTGLETNEVVIIGKQNQLITFDKKQRTLTNLTLENKIKKIVHMVSKINKVIVCYQDCIQIINYRSSKILIKFQIHQIITLQCTPIPDLIAYADPHSVVFFNVKSGSTLFKLPQKNIYSITFNTGGKPLVAFIKQNGLLSVWDLNLKRRQDTLHLGTESACKISFLDQQNGVAVGSNDIIQWRLGTTGLEILRQRRGPKGNIKQIQFCDNLRAIGITDYYQGQMRYYSLINQCFSTSFCNKTKKVARTQLQPFVLTQILGMSMSMTRAGQWGNLLTRHRYSNFCGIWSTQDKRIIKKQVEIKNRNIKDRILTAVIVSNCGNFGYLGYDNGLIIKINIQSGKQRDTLKVQGQINSLGLNLQGTLLWISSSKNLTVINTVSNIIIYSIEKQNSVIKQSNSGYFLCSYINKLSSKSQNLILYDTNNPQSTRYITYQDTIQDITFTSDNHFIFILHNQKISSIITVYNIVKGIIKQHIFCDIPFSGINITPDDSYLVSWDNKSKQIFIWHNQSQSCPVFDIQTKVKFQTILITSPDDLRKQIFFDSKLQNCGVKNYDFQWSQQQLKVPQQNINLIKFSNQSINKWKDLPNYSQSIQHKKITIKVDKSTQVPFFFDIKQTDQFSKFLKQQFQQKKREKIGKFKDVQAKWMGQTKNLLNLKPDQWLRTFRQMSLSQADYFLRAIVFQNPLKHSNLLNIFIALFQSQQNYDLKILLLSSYLSIAADTIIGDHRLTEIQKLLIKSYSCMQNIRHCLSMAQQINK